MADDHETVQLTADVVLLAEQDGKLHVLLIERGWPPYEGRWALPGGWVDPGEDVEHAARRELAEETGLDAGQLRLVGAYSAPGRDPRGRYVTWAYVALLDHLPSPTAGDDARDARWWSIAEVLAQPQRLAFDHGQILADATIAQFAGRRELEAMWLRAQEVAERGSEAGRAVAQHILGKRPT